MSVKNPYTRTDLALEEMSRQVPEISGISQKESTMGDCKITEISIETIEAAKALLKPVGKYVTIETPDLSLHPENFDSQVEILAAEITKLVPSSGEALIIGLGNNDITPDALGPQVVSQILATRHLMSELPNNTEFHNLRSVSAIAPGVLGQTGIEVSEIAKSIAASTKPAVLVVVDALACSDISRLGRTIQLSDTGISPGSGVQNRRKELSHATIGIPVIAIGIPTVVDMLTIAENITGSEVPENANSMMVTPRDIDKLIERSAKLVAFSINSALLPSLSLEDFSALT